MPPFTYNYTELITKNIVTICFVWKIKFHQVFIRSLLMRYKRIV